MTTFIETFTGQAFQPLSPSVSDIRIADIAHSLSQQCRFSGHTREFYSVAEHSVRVSWLLQDWEMSRRTQLWGLLHDASEAYLVDIPAPVKKTHSLLGYRLAESEVMRAVCERFNLTRKQPDAVTKADAVLLATEARDLMPYRKEHWTSLLEPPLEAVITPWAPQEAERKFLTRYAELTGG